jgi:hypothetical protein
MGLFDSGESKEQRTQLFFFDDGSFKFRKLPFEDACLVEKKNETVVKAWAHFYDAEIPFNGYGSMRADAVTLGFNRDFILDPFNKVPLAENGTDRKGKPKANESSIRSWTAQVAESERYKVMNHPGSTLLINKITMWLGIGLIIELLLFGLKMGLHWG